MGCSKCEDAPSFADFLSIDDMIVRKNLKDEDIVEEVNGSNTIAKSDDYNGALAREKTVIRKNLVMSLKNIGYFFFSVLTKLPLVFLVC